MKRYPPRNGDWYDPATQVQRPIIGLDIDGTLGAYHEHFLEFATRWLGRPLPPASQYRGGPLASFMGVSKATYRKIKLAYRRGGLKRSMPVYDGAPELTRDLRKRGALVVLCTTRPYLSLENIDEDTRHWVRRSQIQHDDIIWGEHKYRDLARRGVSRIVGVLEDLPELARQAEAAGLQAVLRHQPYNDRYVENMRARDLNEANVMLNTMLDLWEERNR